MRQLVFFLALSIAIGVNCTKKDTLSGSVENAAYASQSTVIPDGKIMIVTCDTTFIDDTTNVPPPPADTSIVPSPLPPPEKNIVFFGSSTIALWNVESAFPGHPVKKAGFGGKTWAGLTLLADTISRLNPKQVIIYSGDNDVIARRAISSMTTDIQKLCKKIWEQNPDVHITFLYTKPSDTAFKIRYADGITTGVAAIEYTNRNVANWGKNYHAHHFDAVDSYLPFLQWNPKRIDTKYYHADKLHLNQTTGYPVLNRLVAPVIKP